MSFITSILNNSKKFDQPFTHWELNKPLTEEAIQEIIEAVRVSLSQTPPALVSDIDKYGAWRTGGGSLLKQIDRKIAEELGIPINMTEDPLSTVVVGSGICLERFDDYKSVLKTSPKPN